MPGAIDSLSLLSFFVAAIFCAVFAGSFVAVTMFLAAILNEIKKRTGEGLVVRIARTGKSDQA